MKLSEPRLFATAIAIGNQAIIAGGYSTNGQVLRTIDVLNLDRGEITTVKMDTGRARFAAAFVDRMVFIAGGCLDILCSEVTSSIEMYDEDFNYLYSTTLSEARGCLSSAITSSKLFFFGGCAGIAAMSSAVDVYDIQTRSWSSFHLPVARFGAAAASLEELAVFGGGISVQPSQLTKDVEISQTPFNIWTRANLTLARYGLAAAAAHTSVLFAGGSDLQEEISVVDIYNILDRTWTTEKLAEAKTWLASASAGSRTFFVGGWKGNTDKSDVIEIYDVVSRQWRTWRLASGRYGIAATTANDKLIFAGGQTAGNWSDYQFITDAIDIFAPAVIISQPPESLEVYYPRATPVLLKIEATGRGLKYEWFRNGLPVENSTMTSTIEIALTSHDNGTSYQVLVTDECGDSVISVPTILNLHQIPSINASPVYQKQTLNVTTQGYGTIYTWYLNGKKVDNNLSYLIFPSVSSSLDGTLVAVNISTENDSTWVMTRITVWGPPRIDETMPSFIRLIEMQSYRFTVTASGHRISYVWLLDDVVQAVPLSPANQFVFTANFEPRHHKICVRASNLAGEETSCTDVKVSAYNEVFDGPTYSARHQYFGWIEEGTQVVLHVEINDPNCVAHYWTLNEEKINNTQTTDRRSRYVIDSLTYSANGNYSVTAICYDLSVVSNTLTFSIMRRYFVAIFWIVISAVSIGCIYALTKTVRITILRTKVREFRRNYQTFDQIDGIQIKERPGFTTVGFPCLFKLNSVIQGLLPVNHVLQGSFSVVPCKQQNNPDQVHNQANNSPQYTRTILEFFTKKPQYISIRAKPSPDYFIEFTPSDFELHSEVKIRVKLTLYAGLSGHVIPIRLISLNYPHYAIKPPCLSIYSQESDFLPVATEFLNAQEVFRKYVKFKITVKLNSYSSTKAQVNRGTYKDRLVAVKYFLQEDETAKSNALFEITTHQRLSREAPFLFSTFLGAALPVNFPTRLQNENQGNVRKFIVTEFAAHGSLSSWIYDRNPAHQNPQIVDEHNMVQLRERVNFAQNVALGLKVMHQKGFIHYDIKLENILIYDHENNEQARITDFGSAFHDSEKIDSVKCAERRTASYWEEGKCS